MRYFQLAVMVCVLILAPSGYAGKLVVIGVIGTDYSLGDQLDEEKSIKVPKGAKLTLLAADGQIHKLQGPFEGQPGKADTASADGEQAVAVISRLLSRQDVDKDLLGGIRGQGSQTLPAPHLLSIEQDGHRCLFTKQAIFWRAQADQPLEVTLFDGQMTERGQLQWPAGVQQASLPARDIADASDLVIERNRDKRIFLFMHTAADNLNPTTKTAWMIEQGCLDQAFVLLRSLR